MFNPIAPTPSRLRAFLGCAALLACAAARPARAAEPGLAQRAQTLLRSRCGDCHGRGGAGGVDVTRWRNLVVDKRSIVPQQPDHSELVRRVENNSMPIGSPGLSREEKQLLRDWVSAGAPDWSAPTPQESRPRVTEQELVRAIAADLERAQPDDRPSYRYLSLANLHNNPEVTPAQLAAWPRTLSKLANSLSWSPRIHQPVALGPSRTLLRVDLRDYGWTTRAWEEVATAYPFAYIPAGGRQEQQRVREWTGCAVPHVRLDWFTAHASVPPLYHSLLQIPPTVQELEQKLGVRAEENLADRRVIRAGKRNSGVSRNNRVVERHETSFGAYWKSYDFKSSEGRRNIFQHPLDFHFDGGEMIFHLPNGFQGYMLATADGGRLDEAPIEIVSDHNNREDPVVRNGLSCIGCHAQGMKTFEDQIRPTLALLLKKRPNPELERSLGVYVPQNRLDQAFRADIDRFEAAVKLTGTPLPARTEEEPIYVAAESYFGFLDAPSVSPAQAAADLGLTAVELQKLLSRTEIALQGGLAQLLAPGGGVKRDAWEQSFLRLVEEGGLGAGLMPTAPMRSLLARGQVDSRRTVAIPSFQVKNSELATYRANAAQAGEAFRFWLARSRDLRVRPGTADVTLQGSLTAKPGGEIVLQVTDARGTVMEEATGAVAELDELALSLAERVNVALTGESLPLPASQLERLVQPADLAGRLQAALAEAGPVQIRFTPDRGPDTTYRSGDPLQVLVSADRDCYLTVYAVDTAGRVSLLFPNQFAPDNRLPAEKVRSLGGPDDDFQLTAEGRPGANTLIVVATLQPLPLPGAENGRPVVGALRTSGSETARLILQRLGRGGAGDAVVAASLAVTRFFVAR